MLGVGRLCGQADRTLGRGRSVEVFFWSPELCRSLLEPGQRQWAGRGGQGGVGQRGGPEGGGAGRGGPERLAELSPLRRHGEGVRVKHHPTERALVHGGPAGPSHQLSRAPVRGGAAGAPRRFLFRCDGLKGRHPEQGTAEPGNSFAVDAWQTFREPPSTSGPSASEDTPFSRPEARISLGLEARLRA